MYSKYIGHVAILAMKHFFDLDYYTSYHLFMLLLLTAAFFKFFLARIVSDVVNTMTTIKIIIACLRQRIVNAQQQRRYA